jgi:adenine-specific DNA-methyltransferase
MGALKSLLQQIDSAADRRLPLARPYPAELVAWAGLHGWDLSEPSSQRLLMRQAVTDAAAGEIVGRVLRERANTAASSRAALFQSLCVNAPPELVHVLYEEACYKNTVSYNFWVDLYSALIPQAQRRRIGQFATPEPIADWMAAWLLQFRPERLADVGCGAGNFLLKTAQRLQQTGGAAQLYGIDISPLLVHLTLAAFLTQHQNLSALLPALQARDFLETELPPDVDAVLCNPPYTRHHHIAPEQKDRLHAFFKARLGMDAPRQATLAFYFLLKIIAEMPVGARAAVILPMEVLDARYGKMSRRILCQHTALNAIVHFAPEMNAFHKVDVGASILLFTKGQRHDGMVRHLTLKSLPTTEQFLDCLSPEHKESHALPFGSLTVEPQDDLPAIPKWFGIAARPDDVEAWQDNGLVVPLKNLVKVVRGIATGANEFFALPTDKVRRYGLEPYVVRTVQRNREIQDLVLDERRWQALSDEGRNVWLLYLNGQDADLQPSLREYLAEGERAGYPLRSLVQTRKRWYIMEQREIPALFFTILTRGNPRFILNRAGVRPLNMFSLLYPNPQIIREDATELLWALLNSSFSLSRLHSVSRTYGGKTLKVEPRELDNLPVVNPLRLPEKDKQTIRAHVAEYYRHPQAPEFIRSMDALIDRLRRDSSGGRLQPSTPVQLRLLEEAESYRVP